MLIIMNGIIPDDIARFIEERIDSVGALEGLLLLRESPQERWGVRALASRLYISEADTEEILRVLCLNGLTTSDAGEPPRYSYAPQTSELRELVDRLASFYSRHVVPVANLIHAKPKHRVQGFADAFRLRKDD
jgi:hypothetical protein